MASEVEVGKGARVVADTVGLAGTGCATIGPTVTNAAAPELAAGVGAGSFGIEASELAAGAGAAAAQTKGECAHTNRRTAMLPRADRV